MLQSECDQDNVDEMYKVKKKCNKNIKVSMSYSHNVSSIPSSNYNTYDDNFFEDAIKYDWEYLRTNEKKVFYCPKQNHDDAKDKAKLIKYDMINSSRLACNLLDEPTRRLLCKLVTNGKLKSINGIISIGKKSIILHATAVPGLDVSVPEEYAIKIFKTTPNMFKPCNQFIAHDFRPRNPRKIAHVWAEREMHIMRQLYFENYPKIHFRTEHDLLTICLDRNNKRTYPKDWPHSYIKFDDAIYALFDRWRSVHGVSCANNLLYWENTNRKEFQMARQVQFLNSPRFRFRSEHILMMSFIGHNEKPASKLKDITLTPGGWQCAYNKVLDAMYELYHRGRLIHGHLCANNILWWKKRCWFIGFSQAVQRDHPNGYKFLLCDCRNICSFFKKKGVYDMKHKEELFEWITGFEVAHFG